MASGGLNLARCQRLAEFSIGSVGLDLSGLVVLTEAATGPYALTAPLAAMAGAEQVVALSRDSRFGSRAEATAQTLEAAEAFSVGSKIDIIEDRNDSRIGCADVVTNLGFVRPLNRELLHRLKPSAAIALMFEAWEFREQDIDLFTCRELDIPVLATDEGVPQLKTLDYLGPVAMRLLFECGIEVYRADLLICGSAPFADALTRKLAGIAGTIGQIDVSGLSSAEKEQTEAKIAGADALIVAEHRLKDRLIGTHGYWTAAELKRINPGLAVVHIAGDVERDALIAECIPHAPQHDFALPGFMSVTTAYVGPRPLIELHAGGLRVGELLARARLAGYSREESERRALAASPLCQALVQPALTDGDT